MNELTINGVEYVKKKGVKKVLEIRDPSTDLPFEIGKSYFIRTVTFHAVGRVEKVVGDFLVLSEASFIGDSGRFMNAIKEGTLNEVEPVGEMYMNVKSFIDAFPWNHSLPNTQK